MRNGLGRSGYLRRSTKTAATVRSEFSARPTPAAKVIASNPPDQSMTMAAAATIAVAAAGVSPREVKRPKTAGSRPSRAIAKATRGPVRSMALSEASSTTPIATAMNAAPLGPKSRIAARSPTFSSALRSVAARCRSSPAGSASAITATIPRYRTMTVAVPITIARGRTR